MKKLYFLNNIVIGVILIMVWVTDYLYFRRMKNKLSRSDLQVYDDLISKIALRSLKEQSTAKIFGHRFTYHPVDTYYVDFVNFHKISKDHLTKISTLLMKAYATHFREMHDVFIYLRVFKLPKSEINSYIHKSKLAFKGAHLNSQNIYHIKLVNEDFDNRLNVKQNSIAIHLSNHKLAELDIFEKIVAKSIYHLKYLNTFDKITELTFKASDMFGKLHEVYYFTLKYRAANYVESLHYINQNKNLVFKDPYLTELKAEPKVLTDAFREKNLRTIYRMLRKADLAIYDTIYFYEEY